MEKIREENALNQYKSDMQTYGIGVIYGRMCPDYKDGLKLVQRRILYGMYEYTDADKRKIKSANVVGQVMGHLHPHGDSAIYDTLKPMTNNTEIYIPLIDKKGNFGSFMGDPAAASRYTECKLSDFAKDVYLKDLALSPKTTDWVDNYDGMSKEPTFLPAALPMLLINGFFGIVFGLKIEIPRHNITEVIDATLSLIDNPNQNITLVPDCCMPCDIIEANWKEISNKGHGKFKVRGKIDIGEWGHKPALFIRTLPDLVFLDTIGSKIEELIEKNKLIGIHETYDKSTTDECKYVIVLKNGVDPNYIRQIIYSMTEMEKSYNVNMEVLDNLNLVRMSYTSYLKAFIEFRKDIKLRLYCSIMQNNMTKIVEKDAFIKLFTSKEADKLIDMIRKTKNTDEVLMRETLIKKLGITELQARYIMNAPIKALSQGHLNRYIEDSKKLKDEYDFYYNKVLDQNMILADIKQELIELRKKYGCPRRCNVISNADASGIPQGEFKIVISNNNMIRKINPNDNIGTFKNDSPKFVTIVDNTKNILLFGADGRVYNLPVYKIPLNDRSSCTDIRILVKNLTADICEILYGPTVENFANKVEKYYAIMITNQGMIKKIDIQDLINVPLSGLIYQKLDPGDLVKAITIAGDGLDAIVFTKHKALRMSVKDIPYLKRSTKGSRAMNNAETIDGMSIIKPDSTDIIVITASGKINRFDITALPRLTRNKSGSKVINLGKNDYIVGVYGVNDQSSVNLVTDKEKLSIPVSDIPRLTSVSAGTKMLKSSDIVLKVKIIHK